ncbi:MAG: alpha/beta fold hydrolase [Alphaproteobacteria bacterium]|nr:alpha/beta fold hydrolase [Alphaproteobacteria bacterium]
MRIFHAVLLLFSLSLAAAPAGARDMLAREVVFGGLAGTFVTPASPGEHKTVVMVAGSGPTDRNGNSKLGVDADYLEMLADAFAGKGIASLRYDKRGVGGSKALVTAEADLRFSDFVGDATTWAEWARAHDGVSCVFMLGHSEGGLIATIVADRKDIAGLVLLSSPGRPLGAVLHDQLSRPAFPSDLRETALTTLRSLEEGNRVADVTPKLTNLFRPSVQPFLISLLNVDPAAELEKYNGPVLIVSGGQDLQVSKRDFALLRKADPDATTVRIAKMNHVLKDIDGDRAANLASYRNPNLPLAAGLVPAVTGFISDTDCPNKG